MNKLPLLLIACLLLRPAFAEEIDHTVLFPKGDAAWTVSYIGNTPQKANGENTPEGNRELMVKIVRQGGLRRDITVWSGGAHTEMWWLQNPTVAVVRNLRGGVNVLSAGEADAVRFDESSFAWVGPQTYTGKQPFRSKPCQLYRRDIHLSTETVTQYAWIDATSHEPAAFFNGRSLVAITLQPEAKIPTLVLPENLRKEMARYAAFFGSVKKVEPQPSPAQP